MKNLKFGLLTAIGMFACVAYAPSGLEAYESFVAQSGGIEATRDQVAAFCNGTMELAPLHQLGTNLRSTICTVGNCDYDNYIGLLSTLCPNKDDWKHLLFASFYSEMHDLATSIIEGRFSPEDKTRYDDLNANSYKGYLDTFATRGSNGTIFRAMEDLARLVNQIMTRDIHNLRQQHQALQAELAAIPNSRSAVSSSSSGYDPIEALKNVLTNNPEGWALNQTLVQDIKQIFVNYDTNPDGVRRLMAICEQPEVRAGLGVPEEFNTIETLCRLVGELGISWDVWLGIQEQMSL